MEQDMERQNRNRFGLSENKKASFFLRQTQSDDDDQDEDQILDDININQKQLDGKEKIFCIQPENSNCDNIQHENIDKTHENIKNITKTENISKTNKIKKLTIRKQTKRWTLDENKLYLNFLQGHAHLFQYKTVRRIRQVFIMLSEKMGGKRTPSQCKSHHQKMKNATQKGTMKQIISYMKQKIVLFGPKMNSRFKKYENQQGIRFEYGWRANNYEIRIKLQRNLLEKW